jgi:hypothetical protein
VISCPVYLVSTVVSSKLERLEFWVDTFQEVADKVFFIKEQRPGEDVFITKFFLSGMYIPADAEINLESLTRSIGRLRGG